MLQHKPNAMQRVLHIVQPKDRVLRILVVAGHLPSFGRELLLICLEAGGTVRFTDLGEVIDEPDLRLNQPGLLLLLLLVDRIDVGPDGLSLLAHLLKLLSLRVVCLVCDAIGCLKLGQLVLTVLQFEADVFFLLSRLDYGLDLLFLLWSGLNGGSGALNGLLDLYLLDSDGLLALHLL